MYGIGPPVGPTSGGKIYAYNNIGTSPQVVVALANPNRTKITFHNPGTVDIFVVPQYFQTSGSNVTNTANGSALGGCLRIFANGGQITIEGECQGQWNAFSASASSNPLTVIDSNV